MALTDKLSAIGEAIRAKTGKSEMLTLEQMPGEIASITGGGGGTADGCVTVTFMNGDTVLFSRPVYIGDDCPEPVAQGRFEAPTKESTAQYNYTFYGWGATDGGAANANILQNVTEDVTVYAIYTATVRTYTITYYDSDGTTVLKTETLAYGVTPSYIPSKAYFTFTGWTPALTTVTGDASYTAQWQAAAVEDGVIQMSWADISAISDAGTAANYFSVGDRKPIDIKGTMGTRELDCTLYVYIIGIYHNSTYEGSGIHFGGFKDSYNSELSLTDTKFYSSTNSYLYTDGTKTFNLNHWGNLNYGGWAGCDLRYDILGSTDVAPSGYGKAVASGRTGYSATSTCATNPVQNTLMSCLPADLRAVMKPITKWADNVGGTTTPSSNYSAVVDYLPLIAFYEIYASTATNSNVSTYEKSNVKQYDYYKTDTYAKCKKGGYPTTNIHGYWLLRSIYQKYDAAVIAVMIQNGGMSSAQCSRTYGISPIFMV